jgi:hypothetical protein
MFEIVIHYSYVWNLSPEAQQPHSTLPTNYNPYQVTGPCCCEIFNVIISPPRGKLPKDMRTHRAQKDMNARPPGALCCDALSPGGRNVPLTSNRLLPYHVFLRITLWVETRSRGKHGGRELLDGGLLVGQR